MSRRPAGEPRASRRVPAARRTSPLCHALLGFRLPLLLVLARSRKDVNYNENDASRQEQALARAEARSRWAAPCHHAARLPLLASLDAAGPLTKIGAAQDRLPHACNCRTITIRRFKPAAGGDRVVRISRQAGWVPAMGCAGEQMLWGLQPLESAWRAWESTLARLAGRATQPEQQSDGACGELCLPRVQGMRLRTDAWRRLGSTSRA